ncbi:Os07g0582900, partial [Oryza sativa Japonica Group]
RPDGPVHGGHRGPQPPRPATGRRRVRHLHGAEQEPHQRHQRHQHGRGQAPRPLQLLPPPLHAHGNAATVGVRRRRVVGRRRRAPRAAAAGERFHQQPGELEQHRGDGEEGEHDEAERHERPRHARVGRDAGVAERALHVQEHGPDARRLLECLGDQRADDVAPDRLRRPRQQLQPERALLPPPGSPRRRCHRVVAADVVRLAELRFCLEQTELGILQ